MQFVVSKQNLQKELGFVQGVVEKKNTIPVLSNILIESVGENNIRLTGTDLDVTIRCDMDAEDISTPGSICVQARKLFEIARLLPDAPVTFKKEDNDWVTVTCDKTRFKMVGVAQGCVSRSAVLEVGPDKDFRRRDQRLYRPDNLRDHAGRVALHAVWRKVYSRRHRRKDGHNGWPPPGLRGAKRRSKNGSDESIDTLIPRKTLAELTKLTAGYEGDISLGMDGNHIFFEVGPRLLISRMLYGQFPNYDMVMPKNNDKSIQFDGALLNPGDSARGFNGRRTLPRYSFSPRAESTGYQFAERRRR